MFLKSLVVTAGALATVVTASGSAFAGDICTDEHNGFGGSTVAVTGDQSGPVTIDSTVVDLRCAAPWYGSAVGAVGVGVSTPIGQQNTVCNDVKAPVTETQWYSHNGVL